MSTHQTAEDYPIWTVPNTVSFLRLTVLLPLSLGLLAAGQYGWSLVALFLWGMSDFLDGFLARKLNQVSELGSELDPLSDRASILIIGAALVFGGLLPWYLFVAIVATDGTLFALSLLWFGGHPDVPVNFIGKTRTALLMLGMPGLILAAATQNQALHTVSQVIVWLGVVAHVITGFTYANVMIRNRREQKRAES